MKNSYLVLSKRLSLAFMAAVALLNPALSHAEEQHGAHQHGKASLTFVLDGNEAELVLNTAAANIVGFEHQPGNAAEQQQQQQQLDMLKSGAWFSLAAAANCNISGQDFRQEQGSEKDHVDLYVNFQILCQAPLKLSDISFTLFSQSPSLEKITVQYLVNGEAGVAELSAEASVLKFAQ